MKCYVLNFMTKQGLKHIVDSENTLFNIILKFQICLDSIAYKSKLSRHGFLHLRWVYIYTS